MRIRNYRNPVICSQIMGLITGVCLHRNIHTLNLRLSTQTFDPFGWCSR